MWQSTKYHLLVQVWQSGVVTSFLARHLELDGHITTSRLIVGHYRHPAHSWAGSKKGLRLSLRTSYLAVLRFFICLASPEVDAAY